MLLLKGICLSRLRERSTVGTIMATAATESWINYMFNNKCVVYSTVSDTVAPIAGSFLDSYSEKSITDVVTPQFKKRVARGDIINNPVTIKSFDMKASPHYISWREVMPDPYYGCGDAIIWTYGGSRSPNFIFGGAVEDPTKYPAPPVIDINHLKQLAVTSAYAKIDNSEAAILATAGEFKETVVSLIAIITRVISIYRSIRRLDLKALAGQIRPKELASRYMEYRYALRPLYYDAVLIINAFNANPKLGRRTFRSRETSNAENHTFKYYTFDLLKHTLDITCHRDVSVSAGVLTDIEFITKSNIWGCDQQLETLWELLPFSFIADWFFNVGKTLASWTPEAGVKELASWVSVKDTSTYTCSIVQSVYTGNLSKYRAESINSSCAISAIKQSYIRLPNPKRSIFPTFKINLDGWKLLDLVIILRQLVSGRT